MNERIENILRLTAAKKIATFKGFERAEEANTYLIHSELSDLGQKAWLWYELSEEFLIMEITCIFGYFDFSEGIDPNYFLSLLAANHPSFRTSCAYVAVKEIDDTLYISLQTSQVFLPKWSDEDIALALAIKFFHLMSGLLLKLPEPVKTFGG